MRLTNASLASHPSLEKEKSKIQFFRFDTMRCEYAR